MAENERVDSFTNSKDMNLNKLWEIVEDRGDWHAAVYEIIKSFEQKQQQQRVASETAPLRN